VTDSTRDRFLPVLLVFLTISVNLPLLTRYPAPGGDEPGFVDAAVTLATRGFLGSEVHRDLLAGIERHLYWQPPLYFVALAGWFRLVGIGLVQARAFSLICAAILVVEVYVLSRRYSPPWPSAIGATLCAVSIWVTTGARFARMDMLCVVLTFACVLSYLQARDSDRPFLFGLCGVLAASAFLTHPLGVVAAGVVSIHLLSSAGRPRIRNTPVNLIAGCFGCGVFLWLVYVLRDPQSFELQMIAQLARKLTAGAYWYQFWMARTHPISLLVVVSAGFWLALKGWRTAESAIASGFLISFAAATYGRETGYFLYFYPWGCCAAAVLLGQVRGRRSLLCAALALAFVNETAILGYDVWRYRGRDYDSLARAVRDAVPAGATVFVGFPEVTPYFALLGRNPMRVAVPVATATPDAHLDAARTSDFIAVSVPVMYLPEVAVLLSGQHPVAIVDQGPGYRLAIFDRKAAQTYQRIITQNPAIATLTARIDSHR
jgi:4-amino-4-deoxy-L-arabinose transferase-like glycosyltransferase